jgi:hypothetical protein
MTTPDYKPNWGPDGSAQAYDQDVPRKRREYNEQRDRLGLGPGDANVGSYRRIVWDALWGFFR